ncbi:hypothetical protein [Streptomyces sp. NPDC058735]|uniref:hypothetical protein n=1 Tax=unclassified Streptomyces TaxID=2593676 RepID=UPI0036A3FF75
MYNIVYTGAAARVLTEDLHHPGCLSSGRKQTAAEQVLEWVRPPRGRPGPERIHWTTDNDRILLSAPGIDMACAELGHSLNACRARLNTLRDGVVRLPG